jgi:hypothetical protein
MPETIQNALSFSVSETDFKIILNKYEQEDYFTVIPFDGAVLYKGNFYSRYQTLMPEDLDFFNAVREIKENGSLTVLISRTGLLDDQFNLSKGVVKANRNISFTFGLPQE